MSLFKYPATISIHHVEGPVPTYSPSVVIVLFVVCHGQYLPIPQSASTVIADVDRTVCGSSENRLRSVGDRSGRPACHFNGRFVCRTIHRHLARRLGSPTGHGTDVRPTFSHFFLQLVDTPDAVASTARPHQCPVAFLRRALRNYSAQKGTRFCIRRQSGFV
ncbi:hypothetical protein QTP88_022741 [Uroleucon formosanum]